MEKFPSDAIGHICWRYCFECTSFRPPRAHHCSKCKACVLRMDHHCPWVGNCVGHKNHKFFILFLLNALSGCIVVFTNMLYTSITTGFSQFIKNRHYLMVMIFSAFTILSLQLLFRYHVKNLLNNSSTLEEHSLAGGNPFSRRKKVY